MLSGRRGERERGPLLWAFVVSLALHALLVPLGAWSWIVRAPLIPPHTERVVASTAVRIEQRPIPVPRTPPATRPVPQPRPQTAQRATQSVAPVAPRPSAAPKHELSRQDTHATPQPQTTAPPTPGRPAAEAAAPSVREQLATQEQNFARVAAQLRTSNNPLSLAPPKRQAPAAFRRSYFDAPGHVQENAVQMQLIPLRRWSSGATICYYARYVAQFATGAGEDGTIPWPVCYPASDDRIANPPYVHDVPLPLPPLGYVLPSGTYLTPLLSRIYGGREPPR